MSPVVRAESTHLGFVGSRFKVGHAYVSRGTAFTNDLYGHLMPGMEQAAAAKVDVAPKGVILTPEQTLFRK